MALAAPASADNGLRVSVNGRGSVFLSSDELDAARDVPTDTRYTRRTASGEETTVQAGGTSAAAVAALLHVSRDNVRAMSVPRVGAGGTISLTRGEVRDGFDGDPQGTRLAIFIAGGHGITFFRPLRDDADSNVRDNITTPNDEDLSIDLATDNDTVRTVERSVDDDTPDPGTPVNFSAHVGSADGVHFTYSWDFADGHGSGATTEHAFAAGHYRVTVTAVGDDGSSGVSDPIDIQVGSPSGQATVTATATPAGTAGPGAGNPGPGTGGGAPTGGGAGDPQQTGSGPSKSHGPRGDGGARPTATPAPRATATPAASATPGARTTPAPVTPLPATTAAPASSPPDATPTATATAAPASPATPGRRVDGVLLAGAGSPTQLAQVLESVPAATTRAPARRGGGGGSPLGWVGGGGLLVLLLGGGAAAELRGLRR